MVVLKLHSTGGALDMVWQFCKLGTMPMVWQVALSILILKKLDHGVYSGKSYCSASL